MASCDEHEVNVSALLDGELHGDDVLQCVDHLLTCRECRRLYGDARGMEDLLAAAQAYSHVSGETAQLWDKAQKTAPPPSRVAILRVAPPWAWRIAATLVAATALWLFGASRLSRGPDQDTTIHVQVGARPELMNEDRFVDVTRELLESDRRYRRKMLEILTAVNQDAESGEGLRQADFSGESVGDVEATAFRGEELAPSSRVVW